MIEIMKRILGFRSMLLMIIALSLLAYNIDLARAEQSIYKPTFSPELIYAGVPTQVRIAIRTGYDTKLIPSSVNLIQIKPNGSKIVISKMYDDATNGDLAANDGIYTVVLDFNEANSSTLTFQVSAAYRGQLRRVLSEVFTLEVKPFPNLEVIWRQYVACLVKKDLEGALVYMTDSAKRHYRRVFTDVGMDTVASDFGSFRDLKLKKINPDKAEYSFMATIDSKNQEGLIVFFYDREWNDVWLIDSVGF